VLFEGNLSYLEELYQAWRKDPSSVHEGWTAWMQALEDGDGRLPAGNAPAGESGRAAAVLEAQTPAAQFRRPVLAAEAPAPGNGLGVHGAAEAGSLQARVESLLLAYREVGYFYARLNPLLPDREPGANYLYPRARGAYERLSLEAFGLSVADLDREFSAGWLLPAKAPLREILRALDQTYCGSIGVEVMHIQNLPIRNWLLRRIESSRNRTQFGASQRRRILEELIQAEEFEQFLHKTFIGQKRFSLEGSEVLIPALLFLLDDAAAGGIQQVVLGTTHRGRITILNRVLQEPAEEIFTLFEDVHATGQYAGSGDVKYHLGFAGEHRDPQGRAVRLVLPANPSHLESVDAVVEGRARGLQSRGDFLSNTKRVLPVILHGDAAFSGQGVAAETLNLAMVQGYHTGGTLHVVVNNQIGFTTSGRDSRSTFFPTDVAKMTSVPVLHVNGDDPEAVVHVMSLALDFRQKMSQDVVVDIFCYRRHGHNEGDEPSFTNPRMYALIREHPGVASLYGQVLAREGVMSPEEQKALRARYSAGLRAALKATRAPAGPAAAPPPADPPRAPEPVEPAEPVSTEADAQGLRRIFEVLTTPPEGFRIHPKLKRILEEKRQRLQKDGTVDWATAEALAFGSLLLEGVPVRLSGQDCGRGTFSQRHAIWWDTNGRAGVREEVPLTTPNRPAGYIPLNHLGPGQERFEVWDSPLSEYSVLAFEYGFSLSHPEDLVIWEAQFGDFANGAQVIIDNFLASAEAKWGSRSGLVLLLPHGYEGQGPEHSSAHLERFLQLAAGDNFQVVNLTTPAQLFHLLRRHARRRVRKPLVVMSPKSLLRHPRAVSRLEELAGGGFHEVLEEADGPGTVRRLVLASGKIYYELSARCRELGLQDTALVRLEQLYPFPEKELSRVLGRFREAESFLWVQEEPENRGALRYLRVQLADYFPGVPFRFVSRPASASPAVGSHQLHLQEQQQVLEAALPASLSSKQGAGQRRSASSRGKRP
jgi:2-oxoglutarate dehydrogenase E1 component